MSEMHSGRFVEKIALYQMINDNEWNLRNKIQKHFNLDMNVKFDQGCYNKRFVVEKVKHTVQQHFFNLSPMI